LYVDHWAATSAIEKFVPSTFPVTAATTYTGKLADGGPDYSVAVDPSNDDLYVDQRPVVGQSRISQFASDGHGIATFASHGEGGELSASEGLAVDGSTGDVYASDTRGGKQVNVYAPAPALPPAVGKSLAANIAAHSAEVQAEVTPNHFATRYRFQY